MENNSEEITISCHFSLLPGVRSNTAEIVACESSLANYILIQHVGRAYLRTYQSNKTTHAEAIRFDRSSAWVKLIGSKKSVESDLPTEPHACMHVQTGMYSE